MDLKQKEKEIQEAGFTLRLLRSSRKSMALEIRGDGSLLIRAPYRMPESSVRRFVREKSAWILSHQSQLLEREPRQQGTVLTEEEKHELRRRAVAVFSEKTAYYAAKANVTYGRITIREQKTRWGSCSRQGNLNFNFRLLLAPEEILDYVVVHELCHRKQMNHSPAFWAEVEKLLPDYRQRRKWLKENGWRLME